MSRDYKPRQAPRVHITVSCSNCPQEVTSMLPPTPDLDEGWPSHRCAHTGRIEPFTRSETAVAVPLRTYADLHA